MLSFIICIWIELCKTDKIRTLKFSNVFSAYSCLKGILRGGGEEGVDGSGGYIILSWINIYSKGGV